MRRRLPAAVIVLGLLAASACSCDEPSSGSPTSTTSVASDSVDADGFPKDFTYPDGAEVQLTAPAHSLYTIDGTDVVDDHWVSEMSRLGFEPAEQSEESGTYRRGSMTIHVTWGLAGSEIRGAANVLTP